MLFKTVTRVICIGHEPTEYEKDLLKQIHNGLTDENIVTDTREFVDEEEALCDLVAGLPKTALATLFTTNLPHTTQAAVDQRGLPYQLFEYTYEAAPRLRRIDQYHGNKHNRIWKDGEFASLTAGGANQ